MLETLLLWMVLWNGGVSPSGEHSTVTLSIEHTNDYWSVSELIDPDRERHSADISVSEPYWHYEGKAGAYVIHYWSLSGETRKLHLWVTSDTTIRLPHLVKSDTAVLKYLKADDYAVVLYSKNSLSCFSLHNVLEKRAWVGKRKASCIQLPNPIKRIPFKKFHLLLNLETALLECGVTEAERYRTRNFESVEYVLIKTSNQLLKVYLPCQSTHFDQRKPIVKALKAIWRMDKLE